MDESWRVPIGSMVPRRLQSRPGAVRCEALHPDDFNDVFGGPPRTVLRHYYTAYEDDSLDSAAKRRLNLYDGEVFRPPDSYVLPADTGSGAQKLAERSLSSRIGGWQAAAARTEDGFYDDIFGSDGRGGALNRKSRTRSWKSNSSSSLLISEDLSPPPPPPITSSSYSNVTAVEEDTGLSSFASKLRPITIPSRHKSATLLSGEEEEEETGGGGQSTASTSAAAAGISWPKSSVVDFRFTGQKENRSDYPILRRQAVKSCCYRRHSLPKEAMAMAMGLHMKKKKSSSSLWSAKKMLSPQDSPSSSSSSSPYYYYYSSSCSSSAAMRRADAGGRASRAALLQQLAREVVVELEDEDDVRDCKDEDDEEEGESSYVIEITQVPPRREEMEGAAAVDEAIAWARENFRIHISSKELTNPGNNSNCNTGQETVLVQDSACCQKKERQEDYDQRQQQQQQGYDDADPFIRTLQKKKQGIYQAGATAAEYPTADQI